MSNVRFIKCDFCEKTAAALSSRDAPPKWVDVTLLFIKDQHIPVLLGADLCPDCNPTVRDLLKHLAKMDGRNLED